MDIKTKICNLIKDMRGGKISLIDGSYEIVKLYNLLPEDEQKKYENLFEEFISIESQTDHLPRNSVRNQWNKESLKEKDKEKKEYENFFESKILDACEKLFKFK